VSKLKYIVDFISLPKLQLYLVFFYSISTAQKGLIMINTIAENYSKSTSNFGLEDGLSELPSNDDGENSIRMVDLYSPRQVTADLPVQVEDNPTGGCNTPILNLQQAELKAINLDTTKFGIVGSGAPAGVDTYKGDAGRDYMGPTKSISETKAEMYSQVDVKLDGIFGKGQYKKPENHYEYVKAIGSAIKMMSPEQQAQFKNDLEKIGQPFKTNFGLSRTRKVGSSTWPVALNTFMVGGFSSVQALEQYDTIKGFFADRDAALGRTPKK
jgi:hypothetical protein